MHHRMTERTTPSYVVHQDEPKPHYNVGIQISVSFKYKNRVSYKPKILFIIDKVRPKEYNMVGKNIGRTQTNIAINDGSNLVHW